MKFGTTRTLLRAGHLASLSDWGKRARKCDHREGTKILINILRWVVYMDFLEETAGISFYITIWFLHLQFKCKNDEPFILVSPEGLIFNQLQESCVGITFRYTNLLLSPLTEPHHTCNIQSLYKRIWGFGFSSCARNAMKSRWAGIRTVRLVFWVRCVQNRICENKLYNYVNFNQTLQKCVYKCLSQSPHFLTLQWDVVCISFHN